MSKLEGLKKGDRIKVTFDGQVAEVGLSSINIHLVEGDEVSSFYTKRDVDSPSFTIEKLPDPIKVGDKVRDIIYGRVLTVVALFEAFAWAKTEEGSPLTFNLHDFERIDQ